MLRERDLDPDQARREAQGMFAGGPRRRSLTRGPKLEGVDAVTWAITVADVRVDTAAHYGDDVHSGLQACWPIQSRSLASNVRRCPKSEGPGNQPGPSLFLSSETGAITSARCAGR